MSRVLPLVFALSLAPAVASALTAQDMVALTRAGVSESVMLAMIDRDKTIFALDAAQVIALKKDGISEKVLMAMLKSGRDEMPLQPALSTTPTLFATEPLLVGVGHGPERPNTYHDFDRLGGLIWPVTTPWLYPSTIPFVYSASAISRQRLVPVSVCSSGQRAASGSRASTAAVNCHRAR